MNYTFTAEQEQFRGETREFLAQTLTTEFWARHRAKGGGSSPEFSRAAADRGWLAVAWPKEYGGRGLSYIEQMIYMEEMADAGAPQEHHRRAIQQVAPSIMLFGSEEQKREYLPRIASGEISFAMGLSEPNAGSDLAAVETEGMRDGDDWILNGRKRFTSGAHFSDYLWTVVRTDPEAPKHRGISMLIVPLNAPGVRVVPLIDLQGRHHFNEVFLEYVRVPHKNMVGEENRGWYVNAATMDFERSGIGRFAGLRKMLDRALDDVRGAPPHRRAGGDYSARRSLIADLAVRAEVSKYLSYRIISLQSAGALPNYEVSIAKLLNSETIQTLSNFAVNFHGLHGELAAGSDDGEVDSDAWARRYVDSISQTIAQGSSEVQRSVVATRGLGLPRG